MELLSEDVLTCAYDKKSFERYREYVSKETVKKISIAYIDIDDMKYILDYYSLPTGDNCLILVASRLKKAAELLFRVAGDEFVLLLFKDDAMAMNRLKEAIHKINTLYINDSGKSILSVSAGVSDYGLPGNIDMLLMQAIERMNRAKELGKNRLVYS